MNQQIQEFYAKVRLNETMNQSIAGAASLDEMIDRTVHYASTLGYSFSREDAMAVLDQDSDTMFNAANDDELTDFELALVSAGVLMKCEYEQNML